MLFTSFPFAIFFVALLLVLSAIPRDKRAGVLLGASLFFYSMWYPIYLLLLLGTAIVNYRLMRLSERPGLGRVCLAASVVFTLSLLGWFKYSAMVVETLLPVLKAGFGVAPPLPDVFLPLGISFYSFQMIALAVDVHRGRTPLPSFSHYLLFISFFPQLIAGPIVRGNQLLPQLEAGGSFPAGQTRLGVWLLCSGLFKKVVMGDFLLAPFVNEVFARTGEVSAGLHLMAMYGFSFQIYFDFSGYTDMAKGLAALLGYRLPSNFHEPYLSLDPSEFWRRWHITLSTWFRDYVYIPLGGNRRGEARIQLNLAVVFLTSGLWHGASWHFVLWGVYHATWIIAHRACRPLLARLEPSRPWGRRFWGLARWLVTFHLVVLGFVLFRAPTAADALTFAGQIFSGSYEFGLPPLETALVAFSLLLHVAERFVRTHRDAVWDALARASWGSLLEGATVGAIVALTLAASGSGGEFIYFAF